MLYMLKQNLRIAQFLSCGISEAFYYGLIHICDPEQRRNQEQNANRKQTFQDVVKLEPGDIML